MSKLFDEWWDDPRTNSETFGLSFLARNVANEAWQACKAKALEQLKAELHTPLEQKKRSFEGVLEYL